MPRLRVAVVLGLGLGLLGCRQGDPEHHATPSLEAGADRGAPEFLVRERDTAIPAAFPLELPALAEVLDGQRLETRAGQTIYSAAVRTQTDDLDEVVAALVAGLDAHGLEVDETRLSGAQAKVAALDARSPDGTIEAGALLRSDERDGAEPGVVVILTWTAASP